MYARFSFVDNAIDGDSCEPHFDVYVAMPKHDSEDAYYEALDTAETQLIDAGYDAENVSGGFVEASEFDDATIAKLEAGEIVIVAR